MLPETIDRRRNSSPEDDDDDSDDDSDDDDDDGVAVLVVHRVNNNAFVVPAKCGYLDVDAAADAIARSIALFATFRPAICVLLFLLCSYSYYIDDDDDDDDKNDKNDSLHSNSRSQKTSFFVKKKAKKHTHMMDPPMKDKNFYNIFIKVSFFLNVL